MKKDLIGFMLAVAALPALARIDNPAKPWSYFVHPVTCIGMPLQTARTGIQVTPEGTVFTGEHELALFFGDERKPLACRQRRFVDDMPIVEDEWRDGDCQYRWTLFGATLPCDPNNDNTAVFARLEVRNVGSDGWWQADMGKVQDVSEIIVIPYYRDAKRPYWFVVKTSVDGVNWTLHIDKRGIWRGWPDGEVPEHPDALHPRGERRRQHRQQTSSSCRSAGEVSVR